jgi:hypothetical protein
MQLAPSTLILPLIPGGPPHSGTTLFSTLLEGHSDINWFIDEGFLFEHVHGCTPALKPFQQGFGYDNGGERIKYKAY